jgi:hypothetical protein
MINIQEHPNDNILSLKVTDKLTKEDLDNLVPHLKDHVNSADHPHLLMIMEGFEGYESATTFWEDLKLDSEYIGYFDRIALVGDKKWQEWGTQLVNPLTEEELRFFSIDEKDEARKWIEDISHSE